jgi:putative ABC transport system permease protein
MIDLDAWHEIVATLTKNKVRTILTALGVAWGVFMLIALLAMGDSLERGIAQQMSGFAPNSVYVWGQQTSLPHRGFGPGRSIEFVSADVDAIAAVPGVEAVAPRSRLGGWHDDNVVTRGARTGRFTVAGDLPAYRQVLRMDLLEGRFLDPLDVRERRKVVVLGEAVYRQLFAPGEAAVGAHVVARGVDFEVIGVIRPRGSGDELDRQNKTLFVPFTTFQQAFNTGDRVGFFALVVDGEDGAVVEERVRAVLGERHDVAPADHEALGSFNASVAVHKLTMLFLGVRLFIWVVGVLTLLAGVLGVSNIMLIAVKERTKELGVRKALGATPAAIVRMVLAESLVLTAAAGYAGFFAAVAAVELLGPKLDGVGPLVAPRVDFPVAIAASLVVVLGGILAGIIPARHAARVKPIEALRADP